jgi:hypothetical protein
MKEIPEIVAHFIDNVVSDSLGEPVTPPGGLLQRNIKASGIRIKNQPFLREPIYPVLK